MQKCYSLHKISDPDRFSFNPADYSRFKFGDDAVAEQFGTALAAGFIADQFAASYSGQQVVVISSPYAFIPTATFALKNHFMNHLNQWLAENGQPVAEETKIHRTVTYKDDYGQLDAAERLRLIINDKFHIDREFLKGKTLLFLDDIKITGSHEKVILKMIREYGLVNEIYHLYFAEMVNTSIHPNIENVLNYYSVKTVADLHNIVSDERFAINTRIVKFILCAPPEAFRDFIRQQDTRFCKLLYNMAIGNSYHTIDVYQSNLNELKLHLEYAGAGNTVFGETHQSVLNFKNQ